MEDLGDPFEHPGSDLWKLRREQRAIRRRLPRKVAGLVERNLPAPDLDGLDVALVELSLRQTAGRILQDLSEAIARLELASDLRLRWEVVSRHRPREASTRFLEQVAVPTNEDHILSVEEDAMKAVNDPESSDLYDALSLIAWADRISEAGGSRRENLA
jgi:hypothetical protein